MNTPTLNLWHSKDSEEVLKRLEANADTGLSTPDAARRTLAAGRNEIPKGRSKPLLQVVLHQFKSPLIYLLLLASLTTALMGESSDAVVILVVVILNAIIGVFQEGKAERSLAALRKLSSVPARVLRDGKETILTAEELVPGDIFILNAGDAVPADGRIISAFSLVATEAPLTGESVPVAKSAEILPEATDLGDRKNLVFSGTFITAGRAQAVVVNIGANTEIGKIARLAGGVKESKTPLEKRVDEFSRRLVVVAAVFFMAIVLIGWWRGIPWVELITIAISQVVGLVPEGLPVAITVALAVGVQRMAANKAIVRKLSAVETLGSTSIICSDKTGTLTRNEMTVTEILLTSGRKVVLGGIGYAPDGEISEANGAKFNLTPDDELDLLIRMSVLCNDADVVKQDGGWRVLGDPTEASLIVMARKVGLSKTDLKQKFPRSGEIPFDSSIKAMVTEHKPSDGQSFLALKGAANVLLELSTLDESHKKKILGLVEEMASRALRVLAIGYVPGATLDTQEIDSLKGKVMFLGVVGQMDPPRLEVSAAMKECRVAGIRPIMITGDQKITGLAIAKAIGMASENDVAIDSRELESLSHEELENKLSHVTVFARVHPSQKLRIVEALQKQGHVVAMTGDGVNDAPVLSQADVGVAMGITGTEVAKEASKIVITDDNFTTIVSAIGEGRLVYQNIKKVLMLLFSTGIAEVVILFLALLFGFRPPFAAVQILWNNLISEGVIAGNLIMDPRDGSELRRPPIDSDEPLITKLMMIRMFVIVPTMVSATFGWFVFRSRQGIALEVIRSETFVVIFFCEWFNVLNCRSETRSALSWDVLRNKWLVGGLLAGLFLQGAVIFWRPLGDVFRTVPIELSSILYIVLVASLMLWTEEARKFFARRSLAVPAESRAIPFCPTKKT